MAKHEVQCRACGKKFDLNAIPETDWVMPSKGWYYHTKCYQDWKNNKAKTDKDWIDMIYDFIARDLKGEYNWHMCEKQREAFVTKNKFTNKGIYFTLKYFYEVKGNKWEAGHGGIGIVPYVYKDATEYWTNIEWKKHGFMQAVEEQIFERANREVIKIKRPTTKKKKSKYDLDLIEGAEEDDS